MTYKVVNNKNKVIKIECTTQEYLDGRINIYMDVTRRMMANKVIIEIDNEKDNK